MKKFLCILLLSASMINGMNSQQQLSKLETIGLCAVGAAATLWPFAAAGGSLFGMGYGLNCMHAEYYGEECCLDPGINTLGAASVALLAFSLFAYKNIKTIVN